MCTFRRVLLFYGYPIGLALNWLSILDIPLDQKLPVIFHVHMGGYYSGSGNIYGPDFLIDDDVIVVNNKHKHISGDYPSSAN